MDADTRSWLRLGAIVLGGCFAVGFTLTAAWSALITQCQWAMADEIDVQ